VVEDQCLSWTSGGVVRQMWPGGGWRSTSVEGGPGGREHDAVGVGGGRYERGGGGGVVSEVGLGSGVWGGPGGVGCVSGLC